MPEIRESLVPERESLEKIKEEYFSNAKLILEYLSSWLGRGKDVVGEERKAIEERKGVWAYTSETQELLAAGVPQEEIIKFMLFEVSLTQERDLLKQREELRRKLSMKDCFDLEKRARDWARENGYLH